jgi:Carboxypeptidase regulatory-like domain
VRAGSTAVLLSALALAGAITPSASAQTISGQLLEAGSDRAIPFAEVDVMDDGGTVVVSTLADGSGRFTAKLKKAGSYTIYAARLGYYAAVSESITVADRQDVAVAVRLAPSPVEMDSLSVSVAPRVTSLDQVGFYARKASGIGHFLTHVDIERMIGVRTLPDALRGVPGVRLSQDQFGHAEVLLSSTMGLPCSPVLLMDGLPINPPWERVVEPDDVDGAEVYTRPTQIPLRFASLVAPTNGGAESRCGLVVVWTRSGGARRR